MPEGSRAEVLLSFAEQFGHGTRTTPSPPVRIEAGGNEDLRFSE